MWTANLLPGHGFQPITVYKSSRGMTETGRPKKESEIEETAIVFLGALVGASQKEIDLWKQNGHPITHKVIEYSAQAKAKPCEYLCTEDGRQFYIQRSKNPGNLNVTIIYYVEERFDITKKKICM